MSDIKTIYRNSLSEQEELKLADGERLNFIFTTNSSTNSRLRFLLEGKGAEVVVLGFNMAESGSSRIIIDIDHRGEETGSRVVVKSILEGDAETQVDGLVRVNPGAVLTDGGFGHQVLLLSDRARVNTSPSLEVEDSRVQASHSATISGLEKEDLFYLRSRGWSRKQAERLLVYGFAADSLKYLEDEEKVRAEEFLQRNFRPDHDK